MLKIWWKNLDLNLLSIRVKYGRKNVMFSSSVNILKNSVNASA